MNITNGFFHHKIYNFIAFRRVTFCISVILLFFACIVIMDRGFNWGVDFSGGLMIELSLTQDTAVNIECINDVLHHSGFKQVVVQNFINSKDIVIRFPVIHNNAQTNWNIGGEILKILHKNISEKFVIKQMNWIGPMIENHLIITGMIAIFSALLCILVYITFRFGWNLSAGIIISLMHDLIIILGILSICSIEMNITIIAALMSAISYSLNDSIIICDRIRENFLRIPLMQLADIFDISLSQTLNRTIITSVTTVMVLIILLFFGGDMLFGFAATLLIGVIIGTISSIYIASSLAFEFILIKNCFIKKIN